MCEPTCRYPHHRYSHCDCPWWRRWWYRSRPLCGPISGTHRMPKVELPEGYEPPSAAVMTPDPPPVPVVADPKLITYLIGSGTVVPPPYPDPLYFDGQGAPDSGVARARPEGAVEAERRQDQAEPCDTAPPTWTCPTCDALFDDELLMKRHAVQHHDGSPVGSTAEEAAERRAARSPEYRSQRAARNDGEDA